MYLDTYLADTQYNTPILCDWHLLFPHCLTVSLVTCLLKRANMCVNRPETSSHLPPPCKTEEYLSNKSLLLERRILFPVLSARATMASHTLLRHRPPDRVRHLIRQTSRVSSLNPKMPYLQCDTRPRPSIWKSHPGHHREDLRLARHVPRHTPLGLAVQSLFSEQDREAHEPAHPSDSPRTLLPRPRRHRGPLPSPLRFQTSPHDD